VIFVIDGKIGKFVLQFYYRVLYFITTVRTVRLIIAFASVRRRIYVLIITITILSDDSLYFIFVLTYHIAPIL
jgi:hypothetical protein